MMNTAYRAAWAIASRIPLPPSKLAESVKGRTRAAERWAQWASCHQVSRYTVWVHAASVGEAQAIQPVLGRLRAALPGLRIALTHTSPSVTGWPTSLGADRADYAPADQPRAVCRALDALKPSLLLFSRGDLWPVLVASAADCSIPIAVAGAVVPPKSRRLLLPVRAALRSTHARLAFVGANSPGDADRWKSLGTPELAIQVTGDPRQDAVLEHVPDLTRIRVLVAWVAQQPTMIAGSTERGDERALLHGFARTRATHPQARLILVPHEPDNEAVARVKSLARKLGISAATWSTTDVEPTCNCVVVTELGLLADLYALVGLAYVGGGFRVGGIHSVAEPAAYGLPILVGPRAADSAAVTDLIHTGGGVALSNRDPAGELASRWSQWLHDEERRTRIGLAARRWLKGGAATACATRLVDLIQRRQPASAEEDGRSYQTDPAHHQIPLPRAHQASALDDDALECDSPRNDQPGR